MNSTTKSGPFTPGRNRPRLPGSGIWLSAILLATTAGAAINEDEWYDPTDWFDGNNFEYDDTFDYDPHDYTYTGYDYGYDWDYWDDYYDAYDWNDYDTYGVWDYDPYDSSYWDRYDWTNTISTEVADGTLYTYTVWVPDQTDQAQSTSGESQQKAGMGGKKSDKQSLSRLEGTIDGLKTVNLSRSSGATGLFTLARVKLDNGQSTIVNLGRQSRINDANVKKGDKVKVIGRRGAIQGQSVFVAQKLRVNGRDVDANPVIRLKGAANATQMVQSGTSGTSSQSPSSPTSAAKQQMSAAQDEISGKVASIEKAKGSAQSSDRTLVKVTLANDTTETIDFGPGASPEKIGLEEGDTITVRGHRDQAQGRSVFVAELVKIDGERVS